MYVKDQSESLGSEVEELDQSEPQPQPQGLAEERR